MTEVAADSLAGLHAAMLRVAEVLGGSKPWWRGQSNADWGLAPAAHRPGKVVDERNLTFRFKNMAKARHADCPPNIDLPAWLFLMQHYGLPTRLLDWSESPLVALFFAVEDPMFDNEDGALWALNPTRLNKNQTGEGVIFAADHSHVLPLFAEAFVPADEPKQKVLSVLTDQLDLRQLVQQSVFTVHGPAAPLNQLPSNADFVALIRIARTAKQAFREALDLLGVARMALFPDLGNLAADLRSRSFVKDA
jgi:hypothetical protein